MFNRHLQLMYEPQLENILIHPDNHALKELEVCIAPLCFFSGLIVFL